MSPNKKYPIPKLSACLALLALLFSGCNANPTPPPSAPTEPLAYSAIGEVISTFAASLADINQIMLGQAQPSEKDILLTVNGTPLTNQEYLFRQSLEPFSPNPRSDQELQEVLIREKAKLALAAEKNILPTNETIQAHLQAEQNDELLTQAAEKFCQDSSLSLDDYWNAYERYNLIRLLIDDTLAQQFPTATDYAQALDAFLEQPDAIVYYTK